MDLPGRVNEMKRCRVCKTEKPFDAFHVDRNTKDGRANYCRKCRRDVTCMDIVHVRKRVKLAIKHLAERYEVSMSQAVEMLVLDAMLDENLSTLDWGGRLKPAVQNKRRKLHPVTGAPCASSSTRIRKVSIVGDKSLRTEESDSQARKDSKTSGTVEQTGGKASKKEPPSQSMVNSTECEQTG